MFFLETCQINEAYKVAYFLFKIIEIALYIIPVGLIVMISLDFLKNVAAGTTDEMQKNVKIVIKRIIYCILVFLVPLIVRASLNIINRSTKIDLTNAVCIINTKLKNADFATDEDKESYKNSQEKKSSSTKSTKTTKKSSSKKTSTKKTSKTKQKKNNSKTGAELIIANAESYYKKIEKDGNWVHRADKGKYKNYGGWTECCKLVSHVLIESGYLKKGGYLCHVNGSSSRPKGTSELINMEVKKTKDMSKLKKGDIMIKNGSSHNIAIFVKKSNGNYVVYGASSTNEIRKKNHPASNSWWKKHGINYIVRVKS